MISGTVSYLENDSSDSSVFKNIIWDCPEFQNSGQSQIDFSEYPKILETIA